MTTLAHTTTRRLGVLPKDDDPREGAGLEALAGEEGVAHGDDGHTRERLFLEFPHDGQGHVRARREPEEKTRFVIETTLLLCQKLLLLYN